MAETDSWTIGRLLDWTAQYLRERQSDSPRLDAEVLLAEVLGCDRIQLYTRFDFEPDEQVRTQFRGLVRRRAEGAPVAYLVRRREFYQLSFQISPAVLIPRPETEFLVIALLDRVKERAEKAAAVAADVGTGSGCVAIAAARHCPRLSFFATDVSAEALAVARSNAQQHAVQDRVQFAQGDLLEAIPPEVRLDYVVSNPPYVTSDEMTELTRDVKDFEPHMALEGGPQGTTIIERLIPQAAERLRDDGHLLLEISPQLESRVTDLVRADDRFQLLPTLADLEGRPRVVQARRR